MTRKRRNVRTVLGHRLTRSHGFWMLCSVIERGVRCYRGLDGAVCPAHGDTTPVREGAR